MNILVTGGAGFIGAAAARSLAERGDTVVAIDDFNSVLYPASFKEERVAALFDKTSVELKRGSIMDVHWLNQLMRSRHFEAIVHLAAHPNTLASMRLPVMYTEVNILGTLNVLEAATAHSVSNFILAGTSSVYNDEQTPFREDAQLHPRSPYGISKVAAELYCRLWHELYQLPVTVLRFFTVYGPWGRPDMAPLIFARNIWNEQPLLLTEEERQRDFTYIDDIVQGIMRAVDKPMAYQVINLGRGEPVSLRNLIAALEEAAGKTAHIQLRPSPAGELKITYADISKARQLLGYNPTVSVQEGAKRLMQWIKNTRT